MSVHKSYRRFNRFGILSIFGKIALGNFETSLLFLV